MTPIIGIDLGTTNSLVAVMEKGVPLVLPGPDGHTLIPSVVTALDGDMLVGEAARDLKILHARDTVYSVKRFMGKGSGDLTPEDRLLPFDLNASQKDMVKLSFAHHICTPIEVSALILRELKKRAERYFGSPVNRAVITVPAYFNDAQRNATKTAGVLAGLDVLRIVNEPTAACLAYGLDKKKQGIVAVYDLGGGTFDISILKIQQGVFEVLSTSGDTHLGGDDLDQVLAQWLAKKAQAILGFDPMEKPEDKAVLYGAAEKAKCELSGRPETLVRAVFHDRKADFETPLTRMDFEKMIAPVVERTLGPCRQALKDAGIEPGQLTDVVLVGGSSRIPLVRKRVKELFAREPNVSMNPDEAVASGAAIQADILAGETTDMLLLDVVPLSLGLETMGGVVTKLIHRNTTLPVQAKEQFTTYVDGQTGVDIHVVQGEREFVGDCRSLARFQLKGIPPLPAGTPRVEVIFTVDANGILSVRAHELRTGAEASVLVKPTYGLTDAEVETMLESSQAHGAEDLARRQLVEARNNAQLDLTATDKALGKAGHLLGPEERQKAQTAVQELRAALRGDDIKLIRQWNQKLDQATRHLAELLLNTTVQDLLKDKRIDELEVSAPDVDPEEHRRQAVSKMVKTVKIEGHENDE